MLRFVHFVLILHLSSSGTHFDHLKITLQPNCASRIITFEGQKRIVIFAARNIAVGEELCYDYQVTIVDFFPPALTLLVFQLSCLSAKLKSASLTRSTVVILFVQFPLEEAKVPCYCGAKTCRGFMN